MKVAFPPKDSEGIGTLYSGDEPEPADLSWALPRLVNKSSSLSGWHSQSSSSNQLNYSSEADPLEDDDDDDSRYSTPRM